MDQELEMTNFATQEKFGAELEAKFISYLEAKYPKYTIGRGPSMFGKSVYRDDDNHAIPDVVAVAPDGKRTWFECKRKAKLYNVRPDGAVGYSVDEKLQKSYVPFANKLKERVFLVFYHESLGDGFHLIDCTKKPNWSMQLNNSHGETMNVFHRDRCVLLQGPSRVQKHDVNFTQQDIDAIVSAKTLEQKKQLFIEILDRCKPTVSSRPMSAKKRIYWENRLRFGNLNTRAKMDKLAYDFFLGGEGLGVNTASYRRRIDDL